MSANNSGINAANPIIEGKDDVFARGWYRFFDLVARKINTIGGAFSTGATAGTASALPALPAGYMTIVDDKGIVRKVPYYNA